MYSSHDFTCWRRDGLGIGMIRQVMRVRNSVLWTYDRLLGIRLRMKFCYARRNLLSFLCCTLKCFVNYPESMEETDIFSKVPKIPPPTNRNISNTDI